MSSFVKFDLISHLEDSKKFLSFNEKGEAKNPFLADRFKEIQKIINFCEARDFSEEEAQKFLDLRLKQEIKIISRDTKNPSKTPNIKNRQNAVQAIKELKIRARGITKTAKVRLLQIEIKKARDESKANKRVSEELHGKIRELELQIDQVNRDLKGKTEQFSSKEEQVNTLKKELATQTDQLTDLEKDRKAVVEGRDKLSAELTSKTEEIESLNGRITASESAKENLEKQITQLSGEIDDLRKKQEEEKLKLVEEGSKNSRMFQEEIKKKRQEVETLQKKISEKESEIAGLKASLKESKSKTSSLEKELEKKNQENATLSKQIAEVSGQKNKLQEELIKVRAECEKLELALQEKEENQKALQAKLANMENELGEQLKVNSGLISDLAVSQEKVKSTTEELKKTIEELKTTQKKADKEKEELLEKLENAERERSTLCDSYEGLQNNSAAEATANREQIDQLLVEKKQLASELVAASSEKGSAAHKALALTSLERELEAKKKQITDLEGRSANLVSESRARAENLKQMEAELAKFQAANKAQEEKIANLSQENQKYKEKDKIYTGISMRIGLVENENKTLKTEITKINKTKADLERQNQEQAKEISDLKANLEQKDSLIEQLTRRIASLYEFITSLGRAFRLSRFNFSNDSGPSKEQLDDLTRRASAAAVGQTPKEKEATQKARNAEKTEKFLKTKNAELARDNDKLQKELRDLQKKLEEKERSEEVVLSKTEGKEPINEVEEISQESSSDRRSVAESEKVEQPKILDEQKKIIADLTEENSRLNQERNEANLEKLARQQKKLHKVTKEIKTLREENSNWSLWRLFGF